MNRYILGCIAAAALTLNTACTDDLNQFPHNETTSEQVYTNVQSYEAVLGKIYASMTATGQESSGVDYSSNHGENYMRTFLNLQEGPTDEMAYTWLTGDDMTNISFMKWDANDTWVSDMYYRIYYNITLCNEFLRNCSDSKSRRSAIRTSRSCAAIRQKPASCVPSSIIMRSTSSATFPL